MAINLHLLRIFAAVVQQQGFSRAAELLSISQPATSKAVQELERQLDTILLDRSKKTISVTESGAVLYEHAQKIFALERAAEEALDRLNGLEIGRLSIGASHTVGTYLLPPLLGQFNRRYPGIQLSLEIANTQQVADHLSGGLLDLAFVEGPVGSPDLNVLPWRLDQLVAIVASHHPLLARQPITLQQLLAQPFIFREPGSGTREIIEMALRERGLSVVPVMVLGSNQATKQAVSVGLGVTIVSNATISVELTAGVLEVVEVSDFSLTRTLTQLTVRGRPLSRAALAFQELIISDMR